MIGARMLLLLSFGLGALVFGVAALPMQPVAAAEANAQPDAAARLAAGWADFKARFVAPDGRVIDDGNGGVSHSEGQGYGMLLAVAADDALTFSRLWGWTARELQRRPDGLASWRWNPTAEPHLTDANNATDGDLLIAWALTKAARRWHSPEYRAAARKIALAIGAQATFKSRFGLTLKPAASGFGPTEMADGPVVNLSYYVFPALPALAEVAPEVDWAGLTRSGLALLDAARFGPAELPSDWISIAADPKPAQKFPADFSYDAIRVPLYLVWGGMQTPRRLEPFTRLARNGAAVTTVDVSTGLPGKPFYDDGYAAIVRLAACSAGTAVPRPAAPPAEKPHYFATALGLLSLLAAQDRGLPCV